MASDEDTRPKADRYAFSMELGALLHHVDWKSGKRIFVSSRGLVHSKPDARTECNRMQAPKLWPKLAPSTDWANVDLEKLGMVVGIWFEPAEVSGQRRPTPAENSEEEEGYSATTSDNGIRSQGVKRRKTRSSDQRSKRRRTESSSMDTRNTKGDLHLGTNEGMTSTGNAEAIGKPFNTRGLCVNDLLARNDLWKIAEPDPEKQTYIVAIRFKDKHAVCYILLNEKGGGYEFCKVDQKDVYFFMDFVDCEATSVHKREQTFPEKLREARNAIGRHEWPDDPRFRDKTSVHVMEGREGQSNAGSERAPTPNGGGETLSQKTIGVLGPTMGGTLDVPAKLPSPRHDVRVLETDQPSSNGPLSSAELHKNTEQTSPLMRQHRECGTKRYAAPPSDDSTSRPKTPERNANVERTESQMDHIICQLARTIARSYAVLNHDQRKAAVEISCFLNTPRDPTRPPSISC